MIKMFHVDHLPYKLYRGFGLDLVHGWFFDLVDNDWRTKAFIYRRRVAKRGGCFQRRLFVCQCVYPHDNFRTIKRRMMKLGG